MSIILSVPTWLANIKDTSLYRENDFTFIVNGETYQISSLMAELISKKIKESKKIDIGISIFCMDTQNNGDFSNFIDIINSGKKAVSEEELPFIYEIIEILDCDIIQINEPTDWPNLTLDIILNEAKKHENVARFYPQRYQEEISFISSHFYLICENQRDQLAELHFDTLNNILKNPKLKLYEEDQLIDFLNFLYRPNSNYKYLYEYVNFSNISIEKMDEFESIFDPNDITGEVWKRIIKSKKTIIIRDRYIKNLFTYDKESPFKGIIHYLKSNKNYTIGIDSTPLYREDCKPENVIIYDDRTKFYHSRVKHIGSNEEDNWICFDFGEYRVILYSYLIKSGRWIIGSGHPMNWKIEGSNDKKVWEDIDNKKMCNELNGTHIDKNFPIENIKKQEFRYIRMKETGGCADGSHYLAFDSFEVYGELIEPNN